MSKLEDCIAGYLSNTAPPGLVLEAIEKVEFGERGGVLSPEKILVEVTFTTKWRVPVFVGERELREAEERGYRRGLREAATRSGGKGLDVTVSLDARLPLDPSYKLYKARA